MQVKDLNKNVPLLGIKVRVPKKYEDLYGDVKGTMYFYSYWTNGLWFKKDMKEDQVYPLIINPKELLEFEVIDETS